MSKRKEIDLERQAEILIEGIKKSFWKLEELDLRNEYITAISMCGKDIVGDETAATATILAKYVNDDKSPQLDLPGCVEKLSEIYLLMKEDPTRMSEKELGVNWKKSKIGTQLSKEILSEKELENFSEGGIGDILRDNGWEVM